MPADREPIPGLPIQKDWKVLAVREGKKEPNPKGGEFQKFYVDFEGAKDVYWRRKLPATVDVGSTYFGTISEGDYGPLFKKESPGGFAGGRGGAGNGAGSFTPQSPLDPEHLARVTRARAQRLAVQVLLARDALTGDEDTARELIVQWTDWFVDDAG
jgi:hypothetical protein